MHRRQRRVPLASPRPPVQRTCGVLSRRASTVPEALPSKRTHPPSAAHSAPCGGGTLLPRRCPLRGSTIQARPTVRRAEGNAAPATPPSKRTHPPSAAHDALCGGGTLISRRLKKRGQDAQHGVQQAAEETAAAVVRFHGAAPVSYTHLDVYKRQVLPKQLSGDDLRHRRRPGQRALLH